MTELKKRVFSLVEPVLAREGFELIEVESASEHGKNILRLYIDTVPPGTAAAGVTVDHCQHVSRLIGDVLDVEGLMTSRYSLEVSSPGLYRPLTKPEHFDRAIGTRVRIKTQDKIAGRRVFLGILKERNGAEVTLDVDGTDFVLGMSYVARATLEPLL